MILHQVSAAQLICATTITKIATKRCSKKISVVKKAFLHSCCFTLVTKKFKKILVEEFLCIEITVLQSPTLPTIELLQSHFSKVLITIVELYIIAYSLLTSYKSILLIKLFIFLPYKALLINLCNAFSCLSPFFFLSLFSFLC